MRRRAFLGLCGVGLAALVKNPSEALASTSGLTVGLTNTIFPGVSDSWLATAAKPFKTLMEQATGVNGSVIVQGGSAFSLGSKLKKDEAQLGVFQGIEFAWARVRNPQLEPIVLCVNQARTVKANLIVRTSWSGKKPADLEKKTLILPAETREHCHAFLERKCVPASSTPKKFFQTIRKAGDVEEALDEVVDSNATAALVDALAWSSYQKGKPGCAKKLRVLAASEAFPVGIVGCQQGKFSKEQLRRFREGLIDARNSTTGKKMLAFLRLTTFEAIPSDYDDLLTSIAKSYPPA